MITARAAKEKTIEGRLKKELAEIETRINSAIESNCFFTRVSRISQEAEKTLRDLGYIVEHWEDSDGEIWCISWDNASD